MIGSISEGYGLAAGPPTNQADCQAGGADPLLAVMVGPFVANGSVGAIAAWLTLPEPRGTDAFLRSHRRLVPSWFPLAPR